MNTLRSAVQRRAHQPPAQLRCAAFVVLVLLAATQPALGRTWQIRVDGSGDAPTIQAGVDSATVGDTLRVGPGIYYEHVQIFYPKALLLQSVAGAEATVIDAQASGRGLWMRNATVDGFTIRNGLVTDTGGGVSIFSPDFSVVRNCIIEDNRAGLSYDTGVAGGIHLSETTQGVILESNVIRRNVATSIGGGIWDVGQSNIIRRNLISDNRGEVLCGGVYMATTLLSENLIIRNHGGYGGGGVCTPPDAYGGEIRNNTIMGNYTSNGFVHGAGIQAPGAIARISENIVCENHNQGIGGLTGAGIVAHPATIVECNDTWHNDTDEIIGISPASSNVSLDPEFCAVEPLTSLNFLLQQDSPCVPSNLMTCGLIGAAPMGCGTVSVEQRTWSEVKRLFR